MFFRNLFFISVVLCICASCESGPKHSNLTLEVAVNSDRQEELYVDITKPADTLFVSEIHTGVRKKFRQSVRTTEDAMNCEDHLVLKSPMTLNLILEPGQSITDRALIQKKVITAYKCYASAIPVGAGLSPGIITFPTRIIYDCRSDSLLEFTVFRTDGNYIEEIRQ